MEVNMFKIGEFILYKGTGVCKIEDMTEREFGQEVKILCIKTQLIKKKSTIYIPTDSKKLVGKMRNILSEDEIHTILREMSVDDGQWIDDAHERKNVFREAINSGEPRLLIRTVRTLYSRKQELLLKGKKLNLSDKQFMQEAEQMVCDEFAMVLHKKPSEVRSYIENK
ncbi:hypothetical protein P261_01081 [Lachnospiraceae bacterium TWA4]|nr:hypothetical protein P261_01081 [Lachnospiraceae bacterium TWA4]